MVWFILVLGFFLLQPLAQSHDFHYSNSADSHRGSMWADDPGIVQSHLPDGEVGSQPRSRRSKHLGHWHDEQTNGIPYSHEECREKLAGT